MPNELYRVDLNVGPTAGKCDVCLKISPNLGKYRWIKDRREFWCCRACFTSCGDTKPDLIHTKFFCRGCGKQRDEAWAEPEPELCSNCYLLGVRIRGGAVAADLHQLLKLQRGRLKYRAHAEAVYEHVLGALERKEIARKEKRLQEEYYARLKREQAEHYARLTLEQKEIKQKEKLRKAELAELAKMSAEQKKEMKKKVDRAAPIPIDTEAVVAERFMEEFRRQASFLDDAMPTMGYVDEEEGPDLAVENTVFGSTLDAGYWVDL